MFTFLSKSSAWGTAPHNSTLTPHLLHSTKQPTLCHTSDSAHCGLMGVDSLSSRTVSQLSIQVSNAVRVRIVCWGCGRCPLLCLRTIWADVFVVSLEGEQTDSKFIKALKKTSLLWESIPHLERETKTRNKGSITNQHFTETTNTAQVHQCLPWPSQSAGSYGTALTAGCRAQEPRA